MENTGTSDNNANQPPPPLKPGILIVTLHDGRGFSLPPGVELSGSNHQSTLSSGASYVSGSIRPSSASRNPSVVGSYSGTGRPQSASTNINAVPTIHGRYSSKYLPYALVDFDKQQVFINAVSGTPESPVWAGDNTQYKFDVSRTTDLSLSLYIRNPNAPSNAGRNEDIFIGTCKVKPRFEETKQRAAEDAKASKKDKEKAAAAAEQERTLGHTGVDWVDVQYGSGQMRIGIDFVENRQRSLKIEDFELLKVVGKGSFGKVMQVQ